MINTNSIWWYFIFIIFNLVSWFKFDLAVDSFCFIDIIFQDVVSVRIPPNKEVNGELTILGHVSHRLVLSPDWDSLLRDSGLNETLAWPTVQIRSQSSIHQKHFIILTGGKNFVEQNCPDFVILFFCVLIFCCVRYPWMYV